MWSFWAKQSVEISRLAATRHRPRWIGYNIPFFSRSGKAPGRRNPAVRRKAPAAPEPDHPAHADEFTLEVACAGDFEGKLIGQQRLPHIITDSLLVAERFPARDPASPR
jgi:hypothetical protein